MTGDDETGDPPPSDEEAEAPAEHDSDKTIIDAAPPEIDDLLAPDEESRATCTRTTRKRCRRILSRRSS